MKSFTKLMIVSFLVIGILLSNYVFQSKNEKSKALDSSQLESIYLNDAEHYGIFSKIFDNDDLTTSISTEQLEFLVDATEKKIISLQMEKNNDFKAKMVEKSNTREGVLTALYNIVAQFQLPSSIKMSADPIQFMKLNGVVPENEEDLRLASPCTTEEGVIFATKLIQLVYHANEAGGKGFLWRATNGNTTVYMLGSLEIMDRDMYPINKGLLKAYESSSELIVEVNSNDRIGLMNYFDSNAIFEDETTLKDVVSAETYEKVQNACAYYYVHEDSYRRMKPWVVWAYLDMLMVLLIDDSGEVENNYSPSYGIDKYFANRAMLENKPITALESVEFRMEMLKSLSSKTQEEKLLEAADVALGNRKAIYNSREMISEWNKAWQNSDINDFHKSYVQALATDNKEYTEVFFGERDKNMAFQIAELLDKKDGKTYFVVVGSGRLVYKNSIIDCLKEKGYTVEVVDVDKLGTENK